MITTINEFNKINENSGNIELMNKLAKSVRILLEIVDPNIPIYKQDVIDAKQALIEFNQFKDAINLRSLY